jgi:SagB-type dehydrogenase family enzyme
MKVLDVPNEIIMKQLNLDEADYTKYEKKLSEQIEEVTEKFLEARGIGAEFMEKTLYKYLANSDQSQKLPQPPLQKPYDDDAELIDLPDPKAIEIEEYDLRKAIEERKSVRQYADEPLRLEELSYLLWTTQGVKEVYKGKVTFRTVPSAGARHAFETYLLVNNVDGLEAGLYRFLAVEHKLMPMDANSDISEKLTDACWNQKMVSTSAVTFFWTAVPYRMKWRYQERSYRYLHLDAGHVCQNLYLAAESINCGVCAIAAYIDELVNPLLDVDGETEFCIYIATVGKKA